MKIILFLIISQVSFAQNLEEALKREISYVNLQTESLKRDKRKLKSETESVQKSLESEILKLESELTLIKTNNDDLQEQFSRLDKKKKDNFKKLDNLNQLYSLAQNELSVLEQELLFEKKEKIPTIDVGDIQIHQLESVAKKSLELLTLATRVENVRAHYRNAEGDLAMDPITRVGRIGAFKDNQILGPSPEGLLKPIQAQVDPSGLFKLYLFESVFEKVDLKVTANIWDRLADQLPLIVLGLILSLVAYLFTLFARD